MTEATVVDTTTAPGATSGDDTLNPIAPAEKNWGWFAIFNIWANDIQSLFG